VIGDIFLIRYMKMGVLGAAWATSAAQVLLVTFNHSFTLYLSLSISLSLPLQSRLCPLLNLSRILFALPQYVGVAVLLLFGYVGRKPAKGGVGCESIELSSRFPNKVCFLSLGNYPRQAVIRLLCMRSSELSSPIPGSGLG
jgi:hypothetical protein